MKKKNRNNFNRIASLNKFKIYVFHTDGGSGANAIDRNQSSSHAPTTTYSHVAHYTHKSMSLGAGYKRKEITNKIFGSYLQLDPCNGARTGNWQTPNQFAVNFKPPDDLVASVLKMSKTKCGYRIFVVVIVWLCRELTAVYWMGQFLSAKLTEIWTSDWMPIFKYKINNNKVATHTHTRAHTFENIIGRLFVWCGASSGSILVLPWA